MTKRIPTKSGANHSRVSTNRYPATNGFESGDIVVPKHDYSSKQWRIESISGNGNMTVKRLSDGHVARVSVTWLNSHKKAE
jgi:hypothetical protein